MIVGSGPALSDLKNKAASLGISPYFHWYTQVPSYQVVTHLQALDVLCLPSLTRKNWKEQFGRVLAEAMVASCVVVGSSSGEIPKVIGDAGLIFPEGDSEALAGSLEKLASDTTLCQSLRARGFERAQNHFINEVIATKWAKAWHQAATA